MIKHVGEPSSCQSKLEVVQGSGSATSDRATWHDVVGAIALIMDNCLARGPNAQLFQSTGGKQVFGELEYNGSSFPNYH